MTLFRKVFSNQDGEAPSRPIRTSYDLAMAPEPEGVVALDTLNDMFGDEAETDETPPTHPEPNAEAAAEAQALLNSAKQLTPAPSFTSRDGNRNKTRLLGFNPAPAEALDPIIAAGAASADKGFPVGWLVVIEGLGRGAHFPLFTGVATIGRSDAQTVALSFGDTAISRENHASIAYDSEKSGFFVGHGGKSNIIRLNNHPVLSTEPMAHGDHLKIGETTLRLVALCDSTFNWSIQDA